MDKLFKYIKQPLFDNWNIVEKIGQGNYSEVYRIKSGESHAVIKVKSIFADSPENLERKIITAMRESDIMERLKECPYIVKYHDSVFQKINNRTGLFIIKMEELQPLEKRYISENNIRKIALDIAYALEYMHSAGVVHCDVKPDNFFIYNDIYKIGDFNISGYQGMKRSISGTEGYIAPEVYESTVYDARSDIYSFGISIKELMHTRATAGFSAIIEKASCPAVSGRYQSAGEIISDIINLQRGDYINPDEFFS